MDKIGAYICKAGCGFKLEACIILSKSDVMPSDCPYKTDLMDNGHSPDIIKPKFEKWDPFGKN